MKYQMWSVRLHVYSSVIAVIVQRHALVFFLFFSFWSHSNTHKMHWRQDSCYESYCLGFSACKQICLVTFLQSCDCSLYYVTAQGIHEGRLQACAEPSVQHEENEGPKIQCLSEKFLLKLLRLWTNLPVNVFCKSACCACKEALCLWEPSSRHGCP